MFFRPLPPEFGFPGSEAKVNFVASTTRSRLPRSRMNLPTRDSLEPPVYPSAVSTKLPPASR
jgi:hypothetical protein